MILFSKSLWRLKDSRFSPSFSKDFTRKPSKSLSKSLNLYYCRSNREFFTSNASKSQENNEKVIATEMDTESKRKRTFYSTFPSHPYTSSSSSSFPLQMREEWIQEEKSLLKMDKNEEKNWINLDWIRRTRGLDRIVRYVNTCFLPEGYPNSVKKEYKNYFSWVAFQSVCGSATYVFSSKALLVAVGLGTLPAITASGAISWILKDGFGSLGIMLFASKFGTKFDNDAKRNKWRADILHNLGVTLELMTPFFPKAFLLIASVANVLKGVAGLAGGATKASINKNFALNNNLGDITAKAQTQGIACYLVGMSLGIGLSLIPGNSTYSLSTFLTFGVLASIHLFASYKALNHVVFTALNTQRAAQTIEEFIQTGKVSDPSYVNFEEKIVVTPNCLKANPQITLGSSIGDSVSDSKTLQDLVTFYSDKNYFLNYHNGKIHVVLRENADALDLLKAYFNAYHLRITIQSKTQGNITNLTEQSLEYTQENFGRFIVLLKEKGWDLSYILMTPEPNRASW